MSREVHFCDESLKFLQKELGVDKMIKQRYNTRKKKEGDIVVMVVMRCIVQTMGTNYDCGQQGYWCPICYV